MDQFFHTLRKIQKKESNNGTLARVEDTFYQDIHKYLNNLKKSAGADPFSKEYNLIKDTQRVATEICERREHKITDAAVINIHRSYHLFTGKPKFDLVDTTPLNLTPEEEKFYFSLIDKLKEHRSNISLDKLTEDKSGEVSETNVKAPSDSVKVVSEVEKPKDDVLTHLDEISKAEIIKDEKVEPIEKQVQEAKNQQLKNQFSNPISKPKEKAPRADEDVYDLINQEEEFADLESIKTAKESELVTLLVFDNINSIIGVDEKIYGPFYPQDIVIMPKINANIFVKNKKGRIVKA